MNGKLRLYLEALPARQVHLLGVGALLIFLAALWSAGLSAPLAQLRARQAERATLQRLPDNAGALDRQHAALATQVTALESTLGIDAQAGGLDRRQLELIGTVERAAQRHGVLVSSALPTPRRIVAGFTELPFELTASGNYDGVLAWLETLEHDLPSAAVVELNLVSNPASAKLDVRLKFAAYLPLEVAP